MTGPIVGQAAIYEASDSIIAPGPPDTYLGVAGHLLRDVKIFGEAVPPPGIGLPILCAHALECTLKAYLSRDGDEARVRARDVQHNLAKLWNMASEDGLRIPREPPEWVSQLGTLHDRPYHLRYSTRVNGIVSPVPALMTVGLAELLDLVHDQVQSWRASRDP